MAISRERKELLVKEYAEQLNSSEAIIIVSNEGLTVSDLEALRGKVREAEGKFYIVKNTLAKLALKEANLLGVEDLFIEPTGIGFCHNNASGVAKAITDFAKKNDKLQVKGGLLGDKVLDQAAIKNLAGLPSLTQLRGQIVGLVNAPATRLVGALAGGVRQLVSVVNAYAEKENEDKGEEAEEAVAT
ncbi:50S ribosomal protein L10 [Anaerolineales bacterium HSG24]|nr:50S ribosomal protein L10 [Anaerolineales bacterium HSG24]